MSALDVRPRRKASKEKFLTSPAIDLCADFRQSLRVRHDTRDARPRGLGVAAGFTKASRESRGASCEYALTEPDLICMLRPRFYRDC